jgi:hypothetical protein
VDLASVEDALNALEACGANAFDAISCACTRKLIARARKLDTRASALLAARAHDHVERLARRFERARAAVERRIDAAELSHGELPRERAACARGRLGAVRYALRRRASGGTARDDAAAKRERRVRCAYEYEAALADLTATFAVASASDAVPEQAGPYNPLRIASELLEQIRSVSPIYLNVQLKRLEELASILALPELPVTPAKTQPPPGRAQPPARKTHPPARKTQPPTAKTQPPRKARAVPRGKS